MTSDEVLSIFKEITRVPRESGHEEKIIAWLQDFAARHSLECRTDSAGNVLIVKEASPGKENAPVVVLQSHSDMVCEKNSGVEHDFSTDPIKWEIEDGWMIAKDTTLGADCGIGMAAQLAVLTSGLPTGRIEALFTVAEETGLDGAKALEPGFITGRMLINLDSEDEGEIFIGCAGGLDTTARFK
ncbi:MAG: M20/M25/M40 family metallo-hydrolase, partial [Bacteroidetes bacterium]|nr:M20/M25/M40 family metallo-hydrolase [Candidatus Cryptobacteroides excrementavium]